MRWEDPMLDAALTLSHLVLYSGRVFRGELCCHRNFFVVSLVEGMVQSKL